MRVLFGIVWALLLMFAPPLRAAASVPQSVDYFVIITGGELLDGTLADAHTPFITKTLLPLGVKCVGMMIVDDRDDDFMAALRYATNKARLVLVTGGLGPTDNDITRQTLAKFTGIPLKENPELLAEMARRVGTPAEQLRGNLRRQTEVPERGGYLKNSSGSTAGLLYDLGQLHIIALPGPPRELQPMVREQVIPFLVKHYGIRPKAAAITLRFLGLGQSQIDYTLKQKVTLPPNLITASQFEGGRVDFTFSLPDDSETARATLEKLRAEIHACLGDNIYADDATSLEEVVLKKLQIQRGTLALGEIGSGGALTAAFNKTALGNQVLAGEWTAPDEVRLLRSLQVPEAEWKAAAPGMPRLKLAANGAAQLAQSSHALIIGPAEGVEGKAATALALLKLPDGQWESQTFVARSGADAQAQLVTQLLGFLWKKLR